MPNAEVWKSVYGYEGVYEVSNMGRVRRVGGNILAQGNSSAGRKSVTLCRGGVKKQHLVQKLVCEAFHGPRPLGKHVAHWDGDKDNNDAKNLRWATPIENEMDKRRHGRVPFGKRNGKYTKPEKTPRGERHGCAKLSEMQVWQIRRLWELGLGAHRLSEVFDMSKTAVTKIIKGETWRHSCQT